MNYWICAVTLLGTSCVTGWFIKFMVLTLKMMVSDVILSTKPSRMRAFSRMLYSFFAAFSIMAIMPEGVLITPFSTIWSGDMQIGPCLVHGVTFGPISTRVIGFTNGSRRLLAEVMALEVSTES